MKGRVLQYSIQDNAGFISGDDGNRYTLKGADWRSDSPPTAGAEVDFGVSGSHATDVFLALPATQTVYAGVGSKNRVTAALLAFFLGGLGAHKFYLGHTGLGIVFIILTFTIIGAIFFTGPVAFIEFIIYLTKTDEEFERIYVQGRKALF